MIKEINSVPIKCPSSCTWELSDISSDDSGRTTDGKMHIDRIAQKRTLNAVWNGLTNAEAATLLQAVNASVFMSVKYDDAMSGNTETRKFYVGSKSAPVHMWNSGTKVFTSISFNFIEQ